MTLVLHAAREAVGADPRCTSGLSILAPPTPIRDHPGDGHDEVRRLWLRPRHGEPAQASVRFRLIGRAHAPVVIVAGGISADRRACAVAGEDTDGWWQPVVGAGKAVDTLSYRVLAIDWLTGDDYSTPARAITPDDQADAFAALLDALGIAQVHAFVGYSYGGMVGLAFAVRHPRRLRRLVAISAPHVPNPLATAQRSVQRRIVALGQRHGCETETLALARELAITTYRTEVEFAERFDPVAEPIGGGFHFAVEDYLAAQGRKFASRFTPRRFLALSESIDLHHVDPADVTVPTTVVAVRSDRLVPLADLHALVEGVSAPVTLHYVDSRYGHDAALKETDAVRAAITPALTS